MDDAQRRAEAQWDQFTEAVRGQWRDRFRGSGPVLGARAPGRLDVMGGVADYSGGIVLEGTLAEATMAAAQEMDEPVVRLLSATGASHVRPEVEVPLTALLRDGAPAPVEEVRERLKADGEAAWSAYVAGCLHVLLTEGLLPPSRPRGLSAVISSSVPLNAGVSSSAALEVASMAALARLYGIEVEGLRLARLCQMVENNVVGAPCGIMDQVTSMLGRAGHLLRLDCRPHSVLGHEPLPPQWRLVGINSHVQHAVSGDPYTHARVGAFMGLKAVQTASGRDWGGYLCTLSLDDWSRWRQSVPEQISGADFLARYGELPDRVARVDPAATYRPRLCAEHPVQEQARVAEFVDLMRDAGTGVDEARLTRAGALMYAAHASYNTHLRMGHERTDELVELARAQGPARGIYGAKITGGGSGGTVAILCAGPRADDAVEAVRTAYGRRHGLEPVLMRGSSPGCETFGVRRIE